MADDEVTDTPSRKATTSLARWPARCRVNSGQRQTFTDELVKLPHLPLWVYDLEADEDCALMSLSEYGAYIRLLQRQWIEGSIPADPARLARLLRVTDDEMDTVWSSLSPKFVQDGRGRLKNRRLDALRDDAIAKVEKNRRNGSKGGRPSGDKTQRETQKEPNGSIRVFGSVSDSDSTGSEEEKMPGFDRWWKCYRGKRGEKARCVAIWRGKKPTVDGVASKLEPLADEICAAVEAQHRAKHHEYSGKLCWPNASTWLSNRRWEDECASAGKKPKLDPAEYSRLAQKAKETWPDDLGHLPDGADAVRVAVARLQRKEAA